MPRKGAECRRQRGGARIRLRVAPAQHRGGTGRVLRGVRVRRDVGGGKRNAASIPCRMMRLRWLRRRTMVTWRSRNALLLRSARTVGEEHGA